MKNYNFYKSNLSTYPNTASYMTEKYFDLFSNLLDKREKIVLNRKIFRSPIFLIKNLIFFVIFLAKKLVISFSKIISR